jgi:hypothetical protein
MTRLSRQFAATKPVVTKQKGSPSRKGCVNYLKEKDHKTPISAGQQELLHHFIHFHSKN